MYEQIVAAIQGAAKFSLRKSHELYFTEIPRFSECLFTW